MVVAKALSSKRITWPALETRDERPGACKKDGKIGLEEYEKFSEVHESAGEVREGFEAGLPIQHDGNLFQCQV